MTREQKQQQIIIAPHYYLVRDEFSRIKARLGAGMVSPARPMGLEIAHIEGAMKIWEHCLGKRTRRLSSLIHDFSTVILARSRQPSRVDTLRAIIPIEQEVNCLLHLHSQLWQQPFPPTCQDGQQLFSSCIEKIAADIIDLITFFVEKVESCGVGCEGTPGTHVWNKAIECRTEMKAYKGWLRSVAQPPTLVARLGGFLRLMERIMGGGVSRRNTRFCRV